MFGRYYSLIEIFSKHTFPDRFLTVSVYYIVRLISSKMSKTRKATRNYLHRVAFATINTLICPNNLSVADAERPFHFQVACSYTPTYITNRDSISAFPKTAKKFIKGHKTYCDL